MNSTTVDYTYRDALSLVSLRPLKLYHYLSTTGVTNYGSKTVFGWGWAEDIGGD